MRVDLRFCFRATAALAADSALVGPSFGLPRRALLTGLGVATSARAFGRAAGTTPSRGAATPSAASRTNALILYFFENYPYFNETLMTQMVI